MSGGCYTFFFFVELLDIVLFFLDEQRPAFYEVWRE